MAFSTEFVMGAGGSVKEIPVSMSGGGAGTVYPLTTVDAGPGSTIVLTGTMTPGSTTSGARPHLQIGTYTYEAPHLDLTGPSDKGMGGYFTGTVQITVLSRAGGTTAFTGKVYVARV